jgi:hypothetical protein
MMDVKKLYSPDNATATLVCEQCGKTKTINISAVKSNPQKVRCSCSHEFFISIEMRKFYRKKTRLPGEYVHIGEHASRRPDKGRMIVEDLSRGGLGFSAERPHNLRVKDMIQVKFSLDDKKRSEVSKRAVVRWVKNYSAGAEFLDLDTSSESNRALGFYLMPR